MGKLAQTSVKYLIRGHMVATGIVEKPDIIGAIFGQTEGLFGADLDLRELQKTGRIGRIEVNVKTVDGNSTAEVIIPSSLDSTETALIAAGIETIERVGPCSATITVSAMEDVRESKRQFIKDRARSLLKSMQDGRPFSTELSEEIKTESKAKEITKYKGFTSGPNIEQADSVIFVEGRADVLTLLKNGITNVVALGGTDISPDIALIGKGKSVTAFLDGDRGGELILKKLIQYVSVDFLARAPDGKEVEELVKKEIFKALRDKQSLSTAPSTKTKQPVRGSSPSYSRDRRASGVRSTVRVSEKDRKTFTSLLDELTGTRAMLVLSGDFSVLGRVPVNDAYDALRDLSGIYALVLDGFIDSKLLQLAEDKGAKYLVGTSKKGRFRRSDVLVLTTEDIQ